MKNLAWPALAAIACLTLFALAAYAADPVEVYPGTPQTPGANLEPSEYYFTPLKENAYGEGWFFMARFDDGTFFFCNYFITNIGLGGIKADVDATINFPDGTNAMDRGEFKSGSLEAAKDKFLVKIGDSSVSGAYPDFTLHIKMKNVSVDLNYHAELPGWKPNSGNVFFGQEKKKFYKYRAIITRAKVTGTIKAGAREEKVTGYGYSDHGTVNLYPQQYASVWYSLRSFDPHWTVEYLEFTTPEKYGSTRVPVILIGKDGRILYAGTDFTLTKEDVVSDPKSKFSYPRKLTFAVDQPGIKVKGVVKVGSLIESIDLLSKLSAIERLVASFFAKSFIFRHRDTVEAVITTPEGEQSVNLQGVNEVLYVH